MVKVAENQLVDLDLLPGSEQERLKAQADKLAYVSLIPYCLGRSCVSPTCPYLIRPHFICLDIFADSVDRSRDDLPPEAREKIQSLSQGATKVGQDTLNTVGGGVKGVVDTAGNTVGTLGSGVSDTVSGLAGGLGSVAKGAGGTVQAGISSGKEEGESAADTAYSAADQTAEKAQNVAGETENKASATASSAGGKVS